MAREMYLVGVDEEELKPPAPPEQPKTPKGKWENFWYHYKWHTLGIAAAVIVLTVLIVQLATRPKYDYQVMLVTQSSLIYGEEKVMVEELAKYGRDVNGDGKVTVSVEAVYLDGAGQIAMANQTKLITRIAAGDMMFFSMDPKSYEDRIVGNLEDGAVFSISWGWRPRASPGKGYTGTGRAAASRKTSCCRMCRRTCISESGRLPATRIKKETKPCTTNAWSC